MPTFDDVGSAIERSLEIAERGIIRHPIGAVLSGVLLALGVIVGGLALFIIVFIILVQFLS